jgi:hypothetical protein
MYPILGRSGATPFVRGVEKNNVCLVQGYCSSHSHRLVFRTTLRIPDRWPCPLGQHTLLLPEIFWKLRRLLTQLLNTTYFCTPPQGFRVSKPQLTDFLDCQKGPSTKMAQGRQFQDTLLFENVLLR